MKKYIFITIGIISLAVGAIGAAIPLLPSFPFLLLSAYCFGKSSKKLDKWFKSTKLYKNNLESFVKGKGMKVSSKIRLILILTIFMGFGLFMMRHLFWGPIILGFVWLFHILYFIFGVKTIK